MYNFASDYLEGAHPQVMEALNKTNFIQTVGYGEDQYCQKAKDKIKAILENENVDIHFLVGGTQTNMIMISSALKDYQAVIAVDSGHINVHETGAVEFTGHKVLPLPQNNGKISAADLKDYLQTYYADGSYDHMVFPGMVYISHPTEYGTLYTKQELADISSVCREYEIPLFLDGARLGYGLVAETDVTLKDIANYTDVFYIGGTKVGALCGEAVVFPKKAPKHFFTMIKQQGALLAKGRLLGIQFDTLFTGNLYLEISKNAIETAAKLKAALKEKGYEFFINSPTNQIFVILENKKMEELGEKVKFSFWEKYDDSHTVVRFATSWATKMEDIDSLIETL